MSKSEIRMTLYDWHFMQSKKGIIIEKFHELFKLLLKSE